jgi:L-seryl-tRNA(Ser) seleniumtransferase
MTLATAACICGLDVARMNRLPDTRHIPIEIIMPWHQISGYSHAFKASGAVMIGAGIPNDTSPPREVHIISRWDIETAITEKTVAIAYAAREGAHPPLEEVVEIGHKYSLPVVVDAAAQVPPVSNLYRFIDTGADVVCFSGGKGIRGPQASGILCGKKELVASAALQMLDMAGAYFDKWAPPASLIPKDKLRGKPEHGIGRGFKVGKEAIVGLLVALNNFTEEKVAETSAQFKSLLRVISTRIENINGVTTKITGGYPEAFPVLDITIDEASAGISANEASSRLRKEHIFVRETYAGEGRLIIHPINLNDDSAALIGGRLEAAISRQ